MRAARRGDGDGDAVRDASATVIRESRGGVRRSSWPSGVGPGPKGPKPILAGAERRRVADPAPDAATRARRRGCGPGRRVGGDGLRAGPGRSGRGQADWGLPAPIGPATPEDAWKWQGVPPGRGLIRRYEPGEMRYYMGDDGGPSLKWLPPAWPPGQGPDT